MHKPETVLSLDGEWVAGIMIAGVLYAAPAVRSHNEASGIFQNLYAEWEKVIETFVETNGLRPLMEKHK